MSGFFRTKEGRAQAKGYGIGLKVTNELITSHGSRLEVSSTPGLGTKFSFRMPTISA
jgi:two-component system phosphate regulon sensor histidine kinase PhoR